MPCSGVAKKFEGVWISAGFFIDFGYNLGHKFMHFRLLAQRQIQL